MAHLIRRAFFAALSVLPLASGCTNFLVPAGSTVDGSTILTYSADSQYLFGDVGTLPAAKHRRDELREVFSWDWGSRLGAIPQPEETFNVVGNTNEHQLSITETTFGGLSSLAGSKGRAVCNEVYGCIDYGQLIWITLQRARNVKEAIRTVDYLMQTYGYASEGESFSIADPSEVWLMEIIGKGNYSLGAVWVARRVPDGYVCAHANQARIQTFPQDQIETTLFSQDVVDFARHIGAYRGENDDFSFSDVYDPVTFAGARFCEARVFSFFSHVATEDVGMSQYLEYAEGRNLAHRMPLFVKVRHKLSVNDTMWLMRNHYEGTPLDPRLDVGAQAWHLPNRLGEELTWTSAGRRYVNERPIGTHYAAWNIVCNQRPKERFSVMWFGVDDSSFSLHAPFYGAVTRVPPSWSGGNCTGRDDCRRAAGLPGTMTDFSLEAMHWVGQLLSNYAYSRYSDIAPVAQRKLVELEGELFDEVRRMDTKLRAIKDRSQATEAATEFSYGTASRLHRTWKDFFGDLFVTFVDGFTTSADPEDPRCHCKKNVPHWSEDWKERIVQSSGERYAWHGAKLVDSRFPATQIGIAKKGLPPDMLLAIDKLCLPALGGQLSECGGSSGDRLESATIPLVESLAGAREKKRKSGDPLQASAVEASSHVGSVGFTAISCGFLLFSNLASLSFGYWLHSTRTRSSVRLQTAGVALLA